jgi:CheY-specific phosphatase CheX
MADNEMQQMLSAATAEVLESMFFTSPAGYSEGRAQADAAAISARLSFRGRPSGVLGVRVPLPTGRQLAASFRGRENAQLSEVQVGEVVCELANMICGSVLSLVERDCRFDLSQPLIDGPGAPRPECATASRVFELEEGRLAVWLALEDEERL